MSGAALIPAFFNKLGSQISEDDAAFDANMRRQQRYYGGGNGILMKYAKELPQQDRNEIRTPGKVAGDISSAALGGYDPMKQVFAGALEGEKKLYQPSQGPVAGGFAVSSAPADTSNYWQMYRTRRGY